MLMLSIELSAKTGSVALLREESVLASQDWPSSRDETRLFFDRLNSLFEAASETPSALDAVAVGLGPGSFAGCRFALSAATAMMRPDRNPVIGIGSAEALAYDTVAKEGLSSGLIGVVGDARRKRFWVCTYRVVDGRFDPIFPIGLVTEVELQEQLQSCELVVSPDWNRLEDTLRTCTHPNARLISESRSPTAETVGRLAFHESQRNPPDPETVPTPIYLHPPVFVEPRFSKGLRAEG